MVVYIYFLPPFRFLFLVHHPQPPTLVLLPEMIPSLSNPLLFYTTLFQHEGHKVHFNAKFSSLEEFTGISLPLISGYCRCWEHVYPKRMLQFHPQTIISHVHLILYRYISITLVTLFKLSSLDRRKLYTVLIVTNCISNLDFRITENIA